MGSQVSGKLDDLRRLEYDILSCVKVGQEE